MVGGGDDDGQDEQRVHDAEDGEEDLLELGHALLAGRQATAEEARVVHQDGADAERVSEVQRRERSQLVEELVGRVDRLGILAADGVEEAVLLGEQPGRHARVGGEDDEAHEVGERHHAARGGELGVRRGCVVVPCKETN